MNSLEFVGKVNNKEFENGTKFNVYDKRNKLIGTLGVIDTTIVYLDFEVIPGNLLLDKDNYTFEKIEEGVIDEN